ncbi:MAG: xylose isomerase [Clostridia bacterium]|nr:xylose isomerase [Clostridia bacterium]
MKEFFPQVREILYEGPKTDNPFAFRFYNPDEVIGGKKMREHLRFAMSYWHTFCGEGVDMFGAGTLDKSFGGKNPMEIARNRAYAAFELLDKLGLDYYCFHDRDIAPEAQTLRETNARLDEMTALLTQLNREHGKKVLWGTANCFYNPRYAAGAGTSPSAEVFAFAAAQIKKAIEITTALGGSGYVFWGGREGYDTLLNTDMALEQENMARLLRMEAEYARSIGFKGDFYIEPKPKEPTKHQYDFDAATVIGFLKKFGLDDIFKLNIEANHATLAQHTFQHELCVARINGAFGSIDANQGDPLLGWDTDQFPTNAYDAALCMLEVLRAGGFVNGGLNFDAKLRRASCDMDDLFHAYIAGMDTFALGLRIALRIVADGRLDAFVAQRYSSWKTGIGEQIISGRAGIAELERFALEKGDVMPSSGRQEYLENLINGILFTE